MSSKYETPGPSGDPYIWALAAAQVKEEAAARTDPDQQPATPIVAEAPAAPAASVPLADRTDTARRAPIREELYTPPATPTSSASSSEANRWLPVVVQPPQPPAVRQTAVAPKPERRSKRAFAAWTAVAAVALVGVVGEGAYLMKHSGSGGSTSAADKHPGGVHRHGKTQHNKVKVHHPKVESPASSSASPSAHPRNLTPYVANGPSTPPSETPSESPSSTPTQGSTGNGGAAKTLTFANLNVKGGSHTASRGPQSGENRAKQQVKLIKSLGIAVMAVEEFQPPQRNVFEHNLGKNYGIYPSRPQYKVGSKAVDSQESLIYDESQVKLLKGLSLPKIYFGGQHKRIPLAEFRVRGTNQVFYVAGTHDPAHPQYAKYRMLDAEMHAKDLRAIRKAHHMPEILLGDMNQGDTLQYAGNTTYGNRLKNNSVCILERQGGLVDAEAAAHNRTGCSAKTRRRVGFGIVDHGLVTRDIEVSNYREISKHRAHSDHHMMLFDAKIPVSKRNHQRNRR